MQTLGNFQNLAEHYSNARQGFSFQAFDYIERVGGELKHKHVLDIGCGTGIATRALSLRGATVVGSDMSSDMLEEAKRIGGNITYVQAPAHTLPFFNIVFDAITAFSAFHWFSDDVSVTEIKRVLKSGGIFTVVNKNDASGIRLDVVQFFKKYISTPTGKEKYNPNEILSRHFDSVCSRIFHAHETFDLENGIEYLQSIALWNLVPESEKSTVLSDIRTHFTEQFKLDGVLSRSINTEIVIGIKT